MAQDDVQNTPPLRSLAWFRGIRFRDFAVAIGPLFLISMVAIGAVYWFVRPAPANTLTITSGPDGSTFRLVAEKYSKILARNGVKLQILPSEGSLDNLKKLVDPTVRFDLGRNLPAENIHLIGPTVQLVARENLHPALSDLLIEAAREVHGGSSLLQRAGEFPAPLEHEFRLSSDARRFYSSGKSFLYRSLPFWLATLADRLLVVVMPIVVLLIPGFKLVPWLYSWRIRSRIFRWYRVLIGLERRMLAQRGPEERGELLKRLDAIEREVNQMKVPLAFADQFYVLRDHIGFVRERYTTGGGRIEPVSPDR